MKPGVLGIEPSPEASPVGIAIEDVAVAPPVLPLQDGCLFRDKAAFPASFATDADVPDRRDLLLSVRRSSDEGRKTWCQVLTLRWEGLVAKDPASPNVGGRTLTWLKVTRRDDRPAECGQSSHHGC